MKVITIIFIFAFSSMAFAQKGKKTTEKKKEKTYTETEFQAAVKKKVLKTLVSLKEKNIVKFSEELLTKEEALRLRSIQLDKEHEQIQINTKELEKKLSVFQKRQTKLIGCIDETDKQKNKRIDHMVDVISGMKPKNAADILSVQDTAISVRILGLLQPTKVSKIFNLMDKEISARLQKQYMSMKK